MNAVKQEDGLGCAVACVAFVLQIPYSKALELFIEGQRRVTGEANFYCPEIAEILNNNGLKYKWQKINTIHSEEDYKNYSIAFIKRSKERPYGHFLSRYRNQWMDPWINLPNVPIRGGFRNLLPGEPTYLIFPFFTQR